MCSRSAERRLDARVGHVALEVDVEDVLPRRRGLRPALELRQADALVVEGGEALEQRSAAVVHGEDERRLRGAARIDLLDRASDQEEAREVDALVRDAARDHGETVLPRGLFRRDRGDARVLFDRDRLRGAGRVVPALRAHADEAVEEALALLEGDRVAADRAHLLEHGARHADEAVLDRPHFLADDDDVALREQVVHLVDAARDRVLDREERVLDFAAFERVDRGDEALLAETLDARRRATRTPS